MFYKLFLFKKRTIAHSLFFSEQCEQIDHSLIFSQKNEQFAQKTDERIPSPEFTPYYLTQQFPPYYLTHLFPHTT